MKAKKTPVLRTHLGVPNLDLTPWPQMFLIEPCMCKCETEGTQVILWRFTKGKDYPELHNTSKYPPINVRCISNNNFVVVILDCLFKTGKSGTQRYLVLLNVLWFTWLLATSHSILSWVIWLSRSSMMCLKRSRSVSQPSPAEQRMDSSRSFMRCWTSSFSLIHSSFFVLYVVLEISGHWSNYPKIKMSPTFLY